MSVAILNEVTSMENDKRFFGMEWILPFITAIMLYFSYEPAGLGLLGFFAYAPFYAFLIMGRRTGRTVLFSWLAGVIFYFMATMWLRHVTWAGLVAMSVLGTGPYFAVVGLAFALPFRGRSPWLRAFGFAATFTAFEWLLSLTVWAFPWFLVGYTQTYFFQFIQTADVFGVFGVSFVVYLVNAAFGEMLVAFAPEVGIFSSLRLAFVSRFGILIAALGAVVLSCAYGIVKLDTLISVKGPKIGVVQANVPQEAKENALSNEEYEKFFRQHKKMTDQLAKADKPDMIVWPETMFMYPIGEEANDQYAFLFKNVSRDSGVPLFAGAISVANSGGEEMYYNSAYFFQPPSQTLQRYDKVMLVPFSEYIPFKRDWPFMKDLVLKFTELKELPGLEPGAGLKLFDYQVAGNKEKLKFGSLICFEAIYPSLSAELARKGARWIVVVSNDGWFRNSAELEQMADMVRFRAIENRIGIVRSANTGISGFYTPDGSFRPLVIKGQSKGVEGTMVSEMRMSSGLTFYAENGDVLPWLCVAGWLAAAGFAVMIGRAKR